MLLTNTRYTEITGASAPANFAQLEASVVERLGEALNRHLESAERTELVSADYDGLVYPKATPITDVADDYPHDDIAVQVGRPAGYTTTTGLFGTGINPSLGGWAWGELTYTGGYTSSTLPAGLAAAIAWGVHTLAAGIAGTGQAGSPVGIVSLDIAGEYRVEYADGMTAGADGFPLPSRWSHLSDLGGRAVTNALRYRRVPL